jgi:SAM-dependent methyltransferase
LERDDSAVEVEGGESVGPGEYDPLVAVYDWLVPETLLEPAGAVAAFQTVVEDIPVGGRVLDCAAGTGQLAVGLALQGYEVVASDISPAMVARTRDLAREHDVDLQVRLSSWDDLVDEQLPTFDAVFCVGNSLTHARGPRGRRSALAAMRSLLRPHGVLALTSRNWELTCAPGSRTELHDELVVRNGVAAFLIYSWTMGETWQQQHVVEVGVGILDGGFVTPHVARLTFWPFRHVELLVDLHGSGLAPLTDTYQPSQERYLVTATPA